MIIIITNRHLLSLCLYMEMNTLPLGIFIMIIFVYGTIYSTIKKIMCQDSNGLNIEWNLNSLNIYIYIYRYIYIRIIT